ncbi:MAG: AAA family ATPase [Pseudomonadales bacterium]
MSKVILLGGPTGVGKSTTLKLLENRLPKSAVLDADDVWRISDDLAVNGTRRLALSNVINVMQGYFEAGCDLVILTWVFARPQLYEPVIAGIQNSADSAHQVYLIASPDSLKQRLSGRQDSHKLEYALSRLELIQNLPFPKIDTTHLSPTEVVDALAGHIGSL